MEDYSNVVIPTVTAVFCHIYIYIYIYIYRKGWLRHNLSHSVILNLVSEHSEWVGPVVSNEESVEIPEERHHRQQENVERGRSLNHQQSQKILGLEDTASSAFVNIDNWCLSIWGRWLDECGRGRQLQHQRWQRMQQKRAAVEEHYWGWREHGQHL